MTYVSVHDTNVYTLTEEDSYLSHKTTNTLNTLISVQHITFPPLCKHKCAWKRKAWKEASPVAVDTVLQLILCVYDEIEMVQKVYTSLVLILFYTLQVY